MSYEPVRHGRTFRLLLVAGFVAGAALIVFSVATRPTEKPWGILPPVLLGQSALVYAGLFHFPTMLTFDGESLEAVTPARRRAIPIEYIVAIRPARFDRNAAVFEVDHGRPVRIRAARGLRDFAAELAIVRPSLRVGMGWSVGPPRGRGEPFSQG